MLADRLLVGVTVNALGARIPSLHLSIHIQQEERVVLYPCRNVVADGFGLPVRFRRNGLVAQDQKVAYRKHVPFGGVLNFTRASVRTHQPECPLLLPSFEESLPQTGNLGFEAGLDE